MRKKGKRTETVKPKTKDQRQPGQDKSRRLAEVTRQPNPPRRSVRSGRQGSK